MRETNQSQVTEFFFLGLSNDPLIQKVLFILFLLVYLVTVLGNLLLMLLIWIDSQLHTPMYFFLCNLSLDELYLSTIIVPQVLVHLLSRNKIISFTCCAFQLLLSLIFGGTQCALLAVMSCDRYMDICNPLHYSNIMTWKVCVQLAAGSWTSGIFVSLMDSTFILRLPYRGSNTISHFFCEALAMLDLASADTHTTETVIFIMGVVIILIPVSLALVSYSFIIVTVVKMKSAAGRLKAFSTCGSHLIVVIIFYGSATLTYMIPKSSKEFKKALSVFYTMFPCMVNSIIYSLRSKDVKRALKKTATKNFPCRFTIFH